MFLTIKLCIHAKLNCLKKKYLHKMDLALNNIQRLICHKTQTNNQLTSQNLKYLEREHYYQIRFSVKISLSGEACWTNWLCHGLKSRYTSCNIQKSSPSLSNCHCASKEGL